ncbi:AMP-dependent synthetase/ligase [Knoellia sp. Soil729]|uniref:AMP-dependent synthetase/ligase n=1 Tax=Knoellia sp. Soil729 TaxID=1736394 RepID=UPI0006FE1633|nr:AMP-dependent synthetase/ligase [Knoellia sp. Soil729]KRE40191.1 long-chain fatty acid--CoA ligase [Knoellia sp. Soil729]
MHEKSTPALTPATTEGSLADVPSRHRRDTPGRVLFGVRDGDGWRDVSATDFADQVDALAKGFVTAGVTPGSAVGIMSRTRYEWTLTDFALWTAGAIPVPIYETSSPDQVEWILKDSGAVGVVLETEKHASALAGVSAGLPSLAHTWVIDGGDLDALAQSGSGCDDATLAAARADIDRQSVATIIYTSGTTGRPKGVELTHGNFLDLAENTVEKLREVVGTTEASTLLFLPLAHVFARFIEVLCVQAGAKMAHSADIKTLLDDFATYQPTFILAVPRVFEKIYNSAEAKAVAGGKGSIFAKAADTAIAWSEANEAGSVGLGLRVKHAVFDKLVYGKLRDAMGGKVQYAVSGGAPLGTRLGHFFRGIGVTILEGYGLTETTAPITVNLPQRLKVGTVGPPLPGSTVRIADDGEILVKGVQVFGTYRNNPEATSESIRDGWFHTGDIGELDDDGYLRITGRKKEILVTAGGKNVAPAVLEDRLRAHPLVSQCIVVGDQKPFIAALLTLDEEMLPMWAANNGLEGLTPAKARTDKTVLAALQSAVDDANSAVSKAESIRKFAVLETDFTEESGHLTPSLKLKRNIVMRDYADEVDALYGG